MAEQSRTAELLNSSAGGAFDPGAFDPGAFDVYTSGGGGMRRAVTRLAMYFLALMLVGA